MKAHVTFQLDVRLVYSFKSPSFSFRSQELLASRCYMDIYIYFFEAKWIFQCSLSAFPIVRKTNHVRTINHHGSDVAAAVL